MEKHQATTINEIDTLEEIQVQKKRLAKEVEMARQALEQRANPAAWIDGAKLIAGGLIVFGFIALNLKRRFSRSKPKKKSADVSFQAAASAAEPPSTEPQAATGTDRHGGLDKAAAFAFLMPLVRQGVGILLDELEDRLRERRS